MMSDLAPDERNLLEDTESDSSSSTSSPTPLSRNSYHRRPVHTSSQYSDDDSDSPRPSGRAEPRDISSQSNLVVSGDSSMIRSAPSQEYLIHHRRPFTSRQPTGHLAQAEREFERSMAKFQRKNHLFLIVYKE